MFGWEFPPIKSGGLGTACYGLTRGLTNQPVDITFVLPYLTKDHGEDFLKMEGLLNAQILKRIQYEKVQSTLRPYQTPEVYRQQLQAWEQAMDWNHGGENVYGHKLYDEVERYSYVAGKIAREKGGGYDLIHSHDWMTYQAGMQVKRVTGTPFIAHVHATEHDRTGGNPNQYVYDIERQGMEAADLLFVVSDFTKQTIVEKYGVREEKIRVIHNGIDQEVENFTEEEVSFGADDDIVLFLGRITLQKGPEYFVEAARQVLKVYPCAKFVFAGSGDMEARMIHLAAEYGIARHFFFTGFVKGREVDRMFQLADVYVMPSVSEPFGITPLESIKNGTPVIISKQSGVSEVVQHCLKVDFWDTRKMANYIVQTLRHKHTLGREMLQHSQREIQQLSWDHVGERVFEHYHDLLAS